MVMKIKSLPTHFAKQSKNSKIVWIATIFSFLYSTFFALSTSKQQLLDLHSFRQAQTGLGAYWLNESSSWFQYQLPVLGHPWSIPFEFPTYQILSHYLASVSGISLVQTGRLLSYVFLILTFIPIRMMIVDLKLPSLAFPITCLLVLTSSNYLYWSRSFMIETTALFLTISAIAFSLRFALQPRWITLIFAILFTVMSGLTKSTTYLSFLVFMGLAFLYLILFKRIKIDKMLITILGFICIILPSAITTYLWIEYSDATKSLNANGVSLTSTALKTWNYGTNEQRFSNAFWFDLILQRTVLGHLGAGLGIIVITFFLIVRSGFRNKLIVSALIVMFFAPLLVFTNLHLVHWYYQVSNQIYLFIALAIIFGSWIERTPKKFSNGAVAIVLIISILNFSVFQVKFSGYAEQVFTIQNSQILSLANFLKKNTTSDQYILIYGQEWSSALAFAAERKTATLSSWMPAYSESYKNPKGLFNQVNPSAVVDCLVHENENIIPTLSELEMTVSKIGLKNYTEISSCRIWY